MAGFNFDRVIRNFEQLKRTVPVKVANLSVNYFTDTFKKGGFDGKAWQEVQRRLPGTKPYKYPLKKDLGRRSRAILIGKGSGRLRRAVNTSLRQATWEGVKLVVDGGLFPYAKRHNEGLKGMPQRTFMAESKELNEKTKQLIIKEVDKIWRA